MGKLGGLVRAEHKASDSHEGVAGPPEDANDRDLFHDFRRVTAAAVGQPDGSEKTAPLPVAQSIRSDSDFPGGLRPGKPFPGARPSPFRNSFYGPGAFSPHPPGSQNVARRKGSGQPPFQGVPVPIDLTQGVIKISRQHRPQQGFHPAMVPPVLEVRAHDGRGEHRFQGMIPVINPVTVGPARDRADESPGLVLPQGIRVLADPAGQLGAGIGLGAGPRGENLGKPHALTLHIAPNFFQSAIMSLMQKTNIEIIKARVNNLKAVSCSIPKHRLVAVTGVSGSGKSSLLFDTVYTEAQRQLVETFSTFARTRLPQVSRPDVEEIRNLSTAILIDQKKMGSNLRSTVGTATEIVTYLRLLFSRCATPFIGPSYYYSFNHPEGMCPACHGLGTTIRIDADRLVRPELSLREGAVVHPECRVGGFLWRELVLLPFFDPDKKVGDFTPQERHLLLHTEPVPFEKPHGAGTYLKNWEGLARRFERLRTLKAEAEAREDGKDAYDRYFLYTPCPACGGTRLNERARSSRLEGRHIGELCAMEIGELRPFLAAFKNPAAAAILGKALVLLEGLERIGVGYLTLERPVSTLSGGESQRIKTARQLDCGLTDLLYILDEPSAGLHPRDTECLMSLLRSLCDAGNSVFVVEHDLDMIRAAEWVVDLGPAAGSGGGEIVYNGDVLGLAACSSLTGRCLAADRRVAPSARAAGLDPAGDGFLQIRDAAAHNLRRVNTRLPKGLFTCVTGVAGSGKSSLIHECFSRQHPGAVNIDQSPIGRTSRGNLATYTGIFDLIRKSFAASTGREASLFSFNSRGACPKCHGQGETVTELFFLDDVRMVCDECGGKRYRRDVLDLRLNGRNIDDVLAMTAGEAGDFFAVPKLRAQADLLLDVGLDYLKLGQTLSSLSGGEAQRLKIASELVKSGEIYILDEPTTGLHLSDMERLVRIIRRLTAAGNTVIVIEHNLDLIKHADWIIDLGPEGGRHGGRLLYEGPPAGLAACPESHTGRHMRGLWLPDDPAN